jgi:hypothetical protein
VHNAQSDADRGAVRQPEKDELDRVEREEQLQVAAGIGNES